MGLMFNIRAGIYGVAPYDSDLSSIWVNITNGYAVPITWEKSSHSAQTVYKYNGEELKVNDGNTYIQIQPKDQKLEITSDSTQM